MSDILTTLLNETRENGKLLARIDERVVGLTEDVKSVQVKADIHHERLEQLEAPGLARRYLVAVVVTVGSVVGVATAVSAFF
jgi:hypothetical protein